MRARRLYASLTLHSGTRAARWPHEPRPPRRRQTRRLVLIKSGDIPKWWATTTTPAPSTWDRVPRYFNLRSSARSWWDHAIRGRRRRRPTPNLGGGPRLGTLTPFPPHTCCYFPSPEWVHRDTVGGAYTYRDAPALIVRPNGRAGLAAARLLSTWRGRSSDFPLSPETVIVTYLLTLRTAN